MTYTYAVLEVSPAAYQEIRAKLVAAGYQDAVHVDRDGGATRRRTELLDMHGIALQEGAGRPRHWSETILLLAAMPGVEAAAAVETQRLDQTDTTIVAALALVALRALQNRGAFDA